MLVITDPKDQPSNADNAAKLMRLAREFEQQTGRQATIIEPIGNQTAQVIVHRLFEQVKPDASAKASADYFSLYHRVAEDHPTFVPEAARTKDYADAVRVSYPLHPRLMDTAENRLRVMPDYNLSRGTLRLFARMVRDLWDNPSRDPELITAGDIDWSSPRIQTDLLNRLDREKFKAAVGADIEGHAHDLDGGKWGVHRVHQGIGQTKRHTRGPPCRGKPVIFPYGTFRDGAGPAACIGRTGEEVLERVYCNFPQGRMSRNGPNPPFGSEGGGSRIGAHLARSRAPRRRSVH